MKKKNEQRAFERIIFHIAYRNAIDVLKIVELFIIYQQKKRKDRFEIDTTNDYLCISYHNRFGFLNVQTFSGLFWSLLLVDVVILTTKMMSI